MIKFTLKQDILPKHRQASLILGVSQHGELTDAGKKIDKISNGYLSRIIKQGEISGKIGQTLLLHTAALSANLASKHILLVGCGKSLRVNDRDFRKIVASSIRTLQPTSATHLICYLTEVTVTSRDTAWQARQIAETAESLFYRFDQFKSERAAAPRIKELAIYLAAGESLTSAQIALKQAQAINLGTSYTKDLANMPSNVCTPSYLAEQARQLAKSYGSLSVKIVEETEMARLGMGAFLSVAKGSEQNAKLICIEYKGSTKKKAPIAIVGKGITFDTGGISLKPADSMVGMKYDMCGAATVLGTLKAAAELKLPLHLVGLIAATENMPSGNASKPEDIVTTLSGQTVEILNTDAEGRLVLCDTLTYCERYKPEVVIDIATLTGAVVVALGTHASGLLSNHDPLAEELLAAGEHSGDRAWQLPLWDEYQEQIKSPFADIANVGGKAAGTITAACFLSRFANKFHWAHLDVAGTAAMMMGGHDRYATGRPVPLLMQFLINRCQK